MVPYFTKIFLVFYVKSYIFNSPTHYFMIIDQFFGIFADNIIINI